MATVISFYILNQIIFQTFKIQAKQETFIEQSKRIYDTFYNQFFGNNDRKYDRHIENEFPGSSISKKILKIDKFKTQNLELYKSMFLTNIFIFCFIQLFTTFE